MTVLIEGALILLPIQILWIKPVIDSTTGVSLAVEKEEKEIMNA